MSAGNDMDREPGTGDGKPGTRDGAVQCTCVHVRLLNKFTLVIMEKVAMNLLLQLEEALETKQEHCIAIAKNVPHRIIVRVLLTILY